MDDSKCAMSSPTIFLFQRALTFLLIILLTVFISCAETTYAQQLCRQTPTVDAHSTRRINQILEKMLSNSTFFSVFSVALDKDCPFWDDDRQCVIRECTVCHCEDSEVPPAWLREDADGECRDGEKCTKKDKLNGVDRSLTGLAALVGHPVWHTADTDAWTIRDEEEDMLYVDLRKNPEQYTGYSGPSARRVWQAIYDENCFTYSAKCRSGICDPDTCKEERALYTIISGLHASISMHIAKRYLKGEVWGVNPTIYRERLRDHPERISSLNLAFAVVVRAVSKAAAMLHPSHYEYVTGNEDNDVYTKGEMTNLLSLPILRPECEDKVFDESDMFLEKNEYSLSEFRNAFRNISMIMDCVGCEKCRLWGKLQFLGLGTALRILFEEDITQLERNEMIALINLLYKLSSSVMWVEKMEGFLRRDARIKARLGGVIGFVLLILLSLHLRPRQRIKGTVSNIRDAGRPKMSQLQTQKPLDGASWQRAHDPISHTKVSDDTEGVPNSRYSGRVRNRGSFFSG